MILKLLKINYKMFDLVWIYRMLWGLDNLMNSSSIKFIGRQERIALDKDTTNYENTRRIGGEEKIYMLSIARYFGIKIYQNSKLIDLNRESIYVKIN